MLQARLRQKLSLIARVRRQHWRSRLHRDYYAHQGAGLAGKADVSERRAALIPLLGQAAGKSVLDLGCAEGMMLPPFLEAGAQRVIGVDQSPRRIASARRLVRDPRAHFAVVDLAEPEASASESPLQDRFDIVLFLGVYQHLPAERRRTVLRRALKCTRHCFALRTPHDCRAEALAVVRDAGFEPVALNGHVNGKGKARVSFFRPPAS